MAWLPESELLSVNEMSTFSALLPKLVDALAADALTFEGGRPRYFKNEFLNPLQTPTLLVL